MRPFPIGIDDFRKLRENDYYYADKTMFIKEFLDNRGEVRLFTRPRRFGKTLGISMLKYFLKMNAVPGKTDIFLKDWKSWKPERNT